MVANSGYQVDSVKVGNTVLTASEGTYSFVMSGDMTVTVSTSEEGSAVEYINVNKTVQELVEENEWTASAGNNIGTLTTSIPLVKDILTISISGGTGNTASFWNSGAEMRIYGAKSSTVTITVTAAEGYKLNEFGMTFTTSNTNGTFDLTSGNADTNINATSKSYSFVVSSSGSSQLKVSAFSAVYYAG